MSKIERLQIHKLQDGDGHYYWVLDEDLNEFNRYMDEMDGKEYMDCPLVFDSFMEYFEEYRTYGDPDNIPDYFIRNDIRNIFRFE